MSEYFPEPKSLGKVKLELHLTIYAIETDFKKPTWINTLSFVKNVDVACSKPNADKLDIDKLKKVRTNLSNLKSKVIS